MQKIPQLRLLVWLFVLLLSGCNTSSELATKPVELSFRESIAEARFVAKELHFNMQSGVDQQLNASVFEVLKEQLERITAGAPNSDLSDVEKSDLIEACNSLKQNFELVISGAENYQTRFSKLDTELIREIGILESLQER